MARPTPGVAAAVYNGVIAAEISTLPPLRPQPPAHNNGFILSQHRSLNQTDFPPLSQCSPGRRSLTESVENFCFPMSRNKNTEEIRGNNFSG